MILVYFGVLDVWYGMMKNTEKSHISSSESPDDVRFCLNCNDMDDLATSEEAGDLGQLRERFRNCKETGRFDGDLCARLFVADDGIADPSVFTDDSEQ